MHYAVQTTVQTREGMVISPFHFLLVALQSELHYIQMTYPQAQYCDTLKSHNLKLYEKHAITYR